MTNVGFNLGIIRESRKDESRTPLIPKHVQDLKKFFPDIKVIIQPSISRCFEDDEYLKAGAIISEDLNSSDLILGIKEIDTSFLINNKKYLFFSHTSKIQPDYSAAAQGTPGMYKKDLLRN